MKQLALATLVILALGGCTEAWKPSSPAVNERATGDAADRDNTGVNTRDRDTATKTPLDQNENQSDIDITANIRRQVVDTEMSVNAQNVKIMTQDGKVTLRGPVKSDDEKKKIEDIALAVAGVGKVDNQLEVELRP
ncbi:MAG: BON domain-containing protein [Pirellulales bacterium]|jgi:hypothetical protein